MLLVGKPERKRPLGRLRRRWVYSIKMFVIKDEMVWTGLMCLRIWTCGGPL
jgi:hypothetical protein